MRSKATFRIVRWLALVGVLGATGLAAGAALAQGIDDYETTATASNRRVDVVWPAIPEVADTLFGGYNVWRSESPDPDSFQLMRRFQRRFPVTWTYCRGSGFPNCGPVSADTLRSFVDPDSVVTLVTGRMGIGVNAEGDTIYVYTREREYVGVPPHNGFPYYYAVSWYSECLSERNDTLMIHQPQPEIFEFYAGPDTLYGFESESGDTLLVNPMLCRRLQAGTNAPVGSPVTVYQATAESEEALRFYAIEAVRTPAPTFPSTVSQPNLTRVRAIPNPYMFSAPWDEPGRRKVQFVNLTERATVWIFTAAGDLVRKLEHPAPGEGSATGSVDWDLRNADGREVVPGIYLFVVESPDQVVVGRGRLIIVM